MAHKPLWLPHLCRSCHLSSKNKIFYTNIQVTVIAVQDQDLVLTEIRWAQGNLGSDVPILNVIHSQLCTFRSKIDYIPVLYTVLLLFLYSRFQFGWYVVYFELKFFFSPFIKFGRSEKGTEFEKIFHFQFDVTQ